MSFVDFISGRLLYEAIPFYSFGITGVYSVYVILILPV